MDLELTEAQRGARDTARRFARERLERVGGTDARLLAADTFEKALEPFHLRPLMRHLLSGQPRPIRDRLVGGIPTGAPKPVSVVVS